MSVIDDIKEKVKGATRSAVKASNDLIEMTRINLAIKSEEDKLNALMMEIGRKIYEMYTAGLPVAEEVIEKCEDIMEAEATISDLKDAILKIRNLRICENCKAEIDRSDNFCPRCGEKQVEDENMNEDNEDDENNEENEEDDACGVCEAGYGNGEENEDNEAMNSAGHEENDESEENADEGGKQ